jgi:hypothetical protein
MERCGQTASMLDPAHVTGASDHFDLLVVGEAPDQTVSVPGKETKPSPLGDASSK